MARAAALPVPTEHEEQAALFVWLGLRTWLEPRLQWTFAVPNGGDRYIAVAAKLKAEGVKPGVLDVWCPCPVGEFHGLVVEMKRIKGGRIEPEQRVWIDALRRMGLRVEVCKGWVEAARVFVDYFGMPADMAP